MNLLERISNKSRTGVGFGMFALISKRRKVLFQKEPAVFYLIILRKQVWIVGGEGNSNFDMVIRKRRNSWFLEKIKFKDVERKGILEERRKPYREENEEKSQPTSIGFSAVKAGKGGLIEGDRLDMLV